MKKGVILISIAREKIINKQSLIKAIQAGIVRGFGFELDISMQISKDDEYLLYEQIIITPHTASITEESERGYAEYSAENVKAFETGTPIRVVT